MASGANTAVSTAHQRNAIQTSVLAGGPSHRERTASAIVVNGLAPATWGRPSGIEATGTKIDDANVSGKIAVKPIAFAVSGEDEKSPTSAKIHENAYPSSRHSTSPATISAPLASMNPKPAAKPTANSTTSDRQLSATSEIVRPRSTAPRDIGSERKRSIRPFLTSSASPSAVTNPPNAIDWTMIPGIRKST